MALLCIPLVFHKVQGESGLALKAADLIKGDEAAGAWLRDRTPGGVWPDSGRRVDQGIFNRRLPLTISDSRIPGHARIAAA